MFNFTLVRVTGVEPARVSPLDPKSSVYANFTTLAYNASVQIQMPGPQFFSLKNRLHETYVVRIYQNPQIVSSAL